MGKTIREMPESTRPYEKCLRIGPKGLSDEELLAVILRTGIQGKTSVELASSVLRAAGGTLSGLRSMSERELMKIRGIGKVKAIELRCLLELCGRIARSDFLNGPDFSDPERIASFYMEEMRMLDREEVRVLYLNTKSRLIREETVSSGTVNQSLFPVREILVHALKNEAVYMILLHNHPSGDPAPSQADIAVTKNIAMGGKLIGVQLLDHIVLGDHRHVSMRERELFE